MGFRSWLRGLLFGKDKVISVKDYESRMQAIALEEFAVESAVNLIAGMVSKCEFRTFLNGKEQFGDEYYLFNIRPNRNQNAGEFIRELVSKLYYENEALAFEANGQLLVADGFQKKEYALLDDVFTGVTRKGFAFEKPFFASEVLYFRLNNDDVRNLLSSLVQRYSALISKAMTRFDKAGGRRGILKINGLAQGKPDFEKVFQTMMTDRFDRYFNADNAVLPLFDGWDYSESENKAVRNSGSEVTDIKTLTDESFARVCQAFQIPPALLRGEVADLSGALDNFLTLCIDPLCDMMEQEINGKRYGPAAFRAGSRISIDTTCIKHIDVFEVAPNIDKLIASRTYSTNEIRRKLGDIPIGMDWADGYVMTKNYQLVGADGKGEEENAQHGTEI